MKRKKKKLTISKKIIFTFLPLIILIVATETFLYIFPIYQNNDRVKGASNFVMPDKDLIWKLNPTLNGYKVLNSLGFRDDHYDADANIKILLLGDSISWGAGVSETELLFPQLLESMLKKDYKSVEVINASVPGYSTFQELKLFTMYKNTLKPNYLILQVCLNDVTERYNTVAAYGGSNHFLGIDTRSSLKGFIKLAKYSKIIETIVRFKQHQGKQYELYRVENLIQKKYPMEIENAWNTMLKEILKIKKIADKDHIPMCIMLTPYKFQINNTDLSNNKPQYIMAGFCKIHNIPFINFLPIFKQEKTDLFVDANHLSKKGHRIVANHLNIFFRNKLQQSILQTPTN
jgi:lysophospholipase L1-like esterase